MLPYGNGFRGSINLIRIYRCKRVSAYLVDETLQSGSNTEAWLWVAIERIQFTIKFLEFPFSRHRNMIIVELFLSSLIRIYGDKHTAIAMVKHGI